MARRKTRKRRNPAGSLMVLNPRRRRRRAAAPKRRRRSNPSHLFHARRRVTHRRRRRNPGLGGIARGGKILGLPLKGAVSIAFGALAVKAVGNIAGKYIPLPDGPLKKYGVQIGAAIVTSMLARKFLGRAMGEAVATGGAVAIVLGVVNEYVAPHVPFLSEYDDTWSGPGVQAYLPSTMSDGTQWQPSMG